MHTFYQSTIVKSCRSFHKLQYHQTFVLSDLLPRVYADANHNIHHDGRGQSGVVITLGSKIKFTTRSSIEFELVALEDSSTYILWLRCLLKSFNINVDAPTIVYQDNQSTILMAIQNGNSARKT